LSSSRQACDDDKSTVEADLWTTPGRATRIGHDSAVPVAPRRPVELRGKAFRGSAVVAAGKLSPGELRGPAWRRLFRDLYACADLEITHELRAVAAAGLLVPGAVVTGRSAAVLWGVPAAERDDDVELTLPPGANVCRVPGITVRRRFLDAGQLTTRRGARATTPEATAVDLARVGPLDEAVVLIDRLIDAKVTDLHRVRAAADQASGRGCRQVLTAALLADGLAASPQETRLRLILHRSKLPRPVAQFVVRDDSGRIARVDFAWPEAKVAVEYEGRWHGETPQQVDADRRRLNRLTAAGWTVVFVTVADMRHSELIVARIAAALAR
jgi:very-short-patch-repair endonuclease